ncbi:MAG: hypothetical protein MJ152_03800, partial [Clostridia bacterium]|nr:hypothetical protein [Clostridia bacterium]
MKTLKFKWIVWSVAFVMVVCAFLFVVFDSRKVQVLTVQPYYDASTTVEDAKLALPDGIENDAKLIEVAAQNLQDKVSVCTYDANNSIKNGSVPLDFVKNLGPNQIILWQGHGDNVNASGHPALWTNTVFDYDKLDADPQYKEDYDENCVVVSMGPMHDEEAIS